MLGQMFGLGGFSLAGVDGVRFRQLWILIDHGIRVVQLRVERLRGRLLAADEEAISRFAAQTLAFCTLMLGVETDFLYFRF